MPSSIRNPYQQGAPVHEHRLPSPLAATRHPVCLVFALASLALGMVSCGDSGSAPSAPPSTEVWPTTSGAVVYDFSKGDSLAPRDGWSFADPGWKLETIPATGEKALPFRYPGVVPGDYGMTEMRFGMPKGDKFWISFRWHIPANYHHRHDTRLEIPLASRDGWQLGDTVVGTDNVSWGVVSQQDSSGIFLRFALKSMYNEVWNGEVANRTRGRKATALGRSQWPANNKLLAVWADEYSSRGTGSTIVWGTDLDWASGEKGSLLTVGYSVGGKVVTGAPASGGVLIRAQDAGKWIDLVFHGQFSSADGKRDGVIESWFRRQGETFWTQAHDIRDADLNRPTVGADSLRTWQAGYLMGWANSGYDQVTTFHISRIEHSLARPAFLP
ncbi:MAG: hypothetical protein IPK50_03555 [Fibrobacterota bacterium]|nr:hypothetical protein [Fibrobacterota bacterium]QQS05971.1 MAG: hypothetical protein IPK50_03555 [Fibrobacterota bacterium]